MIRSLAVFVIAFLTGLIVFMPLKAIVMLWHPGPDLTQARLHGSVWDGRVENLRWAGGRLQQVHLQGQPFALPRGRLALDWQIGDPSLRGDGTAMISPDGQLALRGVDLVLRPGRLGLDALARLDESLVVGLTLDDLVLQSGECQSAAGRVQVPATQIDNGQEVFAWPALEGDISCRSGQVLLQLSGETQSVRVEGEALWNTAQPDWRVRVWTQEAAVAQMLALTGFHAEDDYWVRDGIPAGPG